MYPRRPFSSFATVLLLCVGMPAVAQESLYDAAKSRRLTPEEQRSFGPKSGSIRYDARMIRAARIAQMRARPKSTLRCWAYVKDALLAANLVDSRPTSIYACQAGDELVIKYGFRRFPSLNPMKAPVGAVVVYGGHDAGHVELRTPEGFVSDFTSSKPYPRPVIGIFVKAG